MLLLGFGFLSENQVSWWTWGQRTPCRRGQALSEVCVESDWEESACWLYLTLSSPAEIAGFSHSAGTVGTVKLGKPGWRALWQCWDPLCIFKSVLRRPSSSSQCHTLIQQWYSISTRSLFLSSIFSAIQ